ncbi:MAG: hypothetical protein ABJC13_09890 [Acidobacteriota bacterium]
MSSLELMIQLLQLLPWLIGTVGGVLVYRSWTRERRLDRTLRAKQIEMERSLEHQEAERRKEELEEARYRRYEEEQKAEEAAVRTAAGSGTGGYIVVDLPDDRRAIFHDLLKGFEEYSRLKGYRVSFSVDSTFIGRIAFKFTLSDSGVIVGTERVRQDLREYLIRVRSGESLDDLPVVISIEEHELVVATLKNRLSFLQHSYNLARNAAEFYEELMRKASTMSVLPAQSIVVQTGGALNAPTYSATNSPQALLGDGNRATNSIRIAVSFRERQEQIAGLEELLVRLSEEPAGENRDEAFRNVKNVKDELEQEDSPETSRVAKWLEKARQVIQLGSLGHQTVQAAKVLFQLFGM